jgi:hypothetical protein
MRDMMRKQQRQPQKEESLPSAEELTEEGDLMDLIVSPIPTPGEAVLQEERVRLIPGDDRGTPYKRTHCFPLLPRRAKPHGGRKKTEHYDKFSL